MKRNVIAKTVGRAVAFAGGQHELVKLSKISGLSITQPAISNAIRKNRCGWKVALALERATKGLVSREELCPETYPPKLHAFLTVNEVRRIERGEE